MSSPLTGKALDLVSRAIFALRDERETTEIVLARHGEAAARRADTPDGSDPPLSDRGVREAQRLAAAVNARPLQAVYTSELRRTRQTAQIVADGAGVDPRIMPEIREITVEYLSEIDPQVETQALDLFLGSGRWDHIPGSEGDDALRARLRAALTAILDRHAGERVMLVTHLVPINAILADLLGIDRSIFFVPPTASLTIIRYGRSGRAFVERIGDVSHLVGL